MSRPLPPSAPARLVRPIQVQVIDMPPDHHVAAHRHDWGQLAYASEGVLSVTTATGTWTVPPQRAVWVPPGIEHAVATRSGAAFRSLYVEAELIDGLPAECAVVAVPPLLRELIVAAARLPRGYDRQSPGGRLAAVILDQLRGLEPVPLHLPMPADPRLARIAAALAEDPGDNRPLGDWAAAVGASERTLARAFTRETGLGFGAWRQRLRLMASLDRLMAGEPVTTVALGLGYATPSAFTAMFRKTLGAPPSVYLGRRD